MKQILKKTIDQLHLEKKDHEFFWDLSLQRFRYLTTRMMARLRGVSPDEIRARLESLAEQGLIRKLYLPDITKPLPGEPIYTLSPKGARLLAHVTHLRPSRLYQPIRKSNFLFLEHSLLINQVRVALITALRARPDVRLLLWRDERWLRAARRRLPRLAVQKGHVGVLPDALFGLEVDGARRFIALEVDRGSMSLQAMRRKWEGYSHLFKSRLYELCFGVPHFEVLVLTSTSRRRERLIKELEISRADCAHFHFGVLSELEEKKDGQGISDSMLLDLLLS